MLTITSKINIIGKIWIVGRIKEINDTQVAEKPNPLNPLIIDAINTMNIIKKNSVRLRFR